MFSIFNGIYFFERLCFYLFCFHWNIFEQQMFYFSVFNGMLYLNVVAEIMCFVFNFKMNIFSEQLCFYLYSFQWNIFEQLFFAFYFQWNALSEHKCYVHVLQFHEVFSPENGCISNLLLLPKSYTLMNPSDFWVSLWQHLYKR